MSPRNDPERDEVIGEPGGTVTSPQEVEQETLEPVEETDQTVTPPQVEQGESEEDTGASPGGGTVTTPHEVEDGG